MMVAKVSGTSAAIGHFQSRPKKAFTVGQPSSEQEATSKRACEGWDYQRTLGRQRGEIARRRIRRRPYCGSNRLLRHFPRRFWHKTRGDQLRVLVHDANSDDDRLFHVLSRQLVAHHSRVQRKDVIEVDRGAKFSSKLSSAWTQCRNQSF